MIMTVHLPIEPFNSAVVDGTAGEKIERIMAEIKPEAAYFSTMDGSRGGFLIVDVAKPSDVPRLAEPWFLTFEADVSFQVCLLPEDLAAAGLAQLGEQWG
jgi:hypothetical protein